LKILVTGGAGYIGSVVAADLMGTGDPPVRVASPEKVKRELHWAHRFSNLGDIIGSAWSWR
jgi:UDP-glucose 4-epimerase